MAAWLNEDEEWGNDVDVWGIKKDSYNFADLGLWLKKGGPLESDSEEGYKVTKERKGKARNLGRKRRWKRN